MKAALEMLRVMERSGVLPDAFVYTCLIDGYSKVLAMDGARWMMEEMVKRNIKPTVVTYTALIIGYLKTGDEKEAEMMYNSMLQAGIAPDGKLSCILGFGNGRSDYDYSQKAKDVT
jgi:pentatricopeptide repeat protein